LRGGGTKFYFYFLAERGEKINFAWIFIKTYIFGAFLINMVSPLTSTSVTIKFNCLITNMINVICTAAMSVFKELMIKFVVVLTTLIKKIKKNCCHVC
jgi:hypothetical protein